MASEQFSNGPQTTLTSSIGTGDTSINVASASGFPPVPQFRIRIDNELLLVTTLSGTSWTVTRGYESTTAASHANGATVLAVLTAGALGGTSDAAAGTPSLRTLGTGSTQACAGNDARLLLGMSPYGLKLVYASASTITVKTGKSIDSSQSAVISLPSDTTITVTTAASAAGNDRKTLSGTVSTVGTAAVTGSGTSFLSQFGTRAGSGTITGASTTITGTGTKFLSEVSVGDLIGTASKGYSRVTAIASDTSLTIVTAIPGGSPGGAAYNIIENPTFKASGGTYARLNSITDDTHLTLSTTTGTFTGVTGYAGEPTAESAGQWLYVWLATGGSGTTCYVSTQRTTPYGVSGYTTAVRRIGVIRYNSSAIMAFSQQGQANERTYFWEVAQASQGTRCLSAGAATSWTSVDCSAVVPPTSTFAVINTIFTGPPATQAYLRPRGIGESAVSRPSQSFTTSVLTNYQFWCSTDGAQCVDYAGSAAGMTMYVDIEGFREDLNS
jgi:hypothetical protein